MDTIQKYLLLIPVLSFCICFSVQSQEQEEYMYRLLLKDKGNPPFSTENPEAFLSPKSVERRHKQHLAVDIFDLPVDPAYLDAIVRTGARIQAHSKWVKTVVVYLSDTTFILSELKKLPFVDSLTCVWKNKLSAAMPKNYPDEADFEPSALKNNINSYGDGFAQIDMNNGVSLHAAGFRGKGISIAVIDGGFLNADRIDFFQQDRIKEVKNFSHETTDLLRSGIDHGTRVLSCMLSDNPGEMIGTAPEADYYLFRTEVDKEEYPVEEDYWIAALEYADSLGVDIVTTSLGYNRFDDPEMDHTHMQLDGKTVLMSKAAGLAASRGLLLFHSAGNEGNKNWRKIIFPADAGNILTIGSITKDSLRSSFSSQGLTADGRIKPDLMAMGSQVNVRGSNGDWVLSNGTSFSTPILAGLGACLWEALPHLSSFEMIKLLRESGNRFLDPDSLTGYGIADVYKAYRQIRTDVKTVDPFRSIHLSVNPSGNRLHVNIGHTKDSRYVLDIYTAMGIKLLSVSNLTSSIDISSFPKGMYIACLQIGETCRIRKFVKM